MQQSLFSPENMAAVLVRTLPEDTKSQSMMASAMILEFGVNIESVFTLEKQSLKSDSVYIEELTTTNPDTGMQWIPGIHSDRRTPAPQQESLGF